MSKFNPFTPGYGLIPPYLAGREKEQKQFNATLDAMAAGRPVSGVTMFGPRGMGKTVLLGWLKGQCTERGIEYLARNPANMLSSVDILGNRLLSAIRPAEGWHIERASIGGKWAKVDVVAPVQGTGQEAQLEDLLISHCREKPLVVLLDEAHAPSDPDALRSFLNLAQEVAQQAPFLLVLAGVPRLPEVLRNAKSTFIERAESVGLGCLDEESAAAALRLPLEKDGITIAESALDQVVEDSQCYPFFIQQWGKALWNHATEKTGKEASELTSDDVDLVMTDIQAMRTDFYKSRFSAIKKSPELTTAVNTLVQALLTDKRNLDEYDLESIIKTDLSAVTPDDGDIANKTEEVMRELIQHDLFWIPPGSNFLAPGIPSFMTYVRNRVNGIHPHKSR